MISESNNQHVSEETRRQLLKTVAPAGFLEGERWLFQGQWIYFDPLNDLNCIVRLVNQLRLRDDPTWFDYAALMHEYFGSSMNCIQAGPRERANALGRALHLW